MPQRAPEGSILRDESAFQLLRRVKKITKEWVSPGKRSGQNGHNVSATISLHENEWTDAGEWMWENRKHYNGLAVLPHNGGTYQQAPFEDCSREKFEAMLSTLEDVDLTKIIEDDDNTDLKGEAACAGGACEIT